MQTQQLLRQAPGLIGSRLIQRRLQQGCAAVRLQFRQQFRDDRESTRCHLAWRATSQQRLHRIQRLPRRNLRLRQHIQARTHKGLALRIQTHHQLLPLQTSGLSVSQSQQRQDGALLKRPPEVAICADESAHTTKDIQDLARRYDAVNVKLDKTGGLTEAIAMVKEAKAAGMGVIVGCMVAGSISMAPAVLLGGLADAIDLDGPLWLAKDVPHGLKYFDGWVSPPTPELWG